MANLLEKVFEEAGRLPESEQEALGALMIEELASERRWEGWLLQSADLRAKLADEALVEHRARRTRPLNADVL